MDSIVPPDYPRDSAWDMEFEFEGRKFSVAHYESTIGWLFAVTHLAFAPDNYCFSTGPHYTANDPERAIREHPKNCADSRAMDARDKLSPWHSCKYDTCCEWLSKSPQTVKQTRERLERYAQSNYEEPERRAVRVGHATDMDTRRRAIALVAGGLSQAAVARQFGVTRQAVSLWVKDSRNS